MLFALSLSIYIYMYIYISLYLYYIPLGHKQDWAIRKNTTYVIITSSCTFSHFAIYS